jgi:hypothetical protein
MKRRTYQTLDGGTVTALRPETEAEARILELSAADPDSPPLDARHSLGDGLDGEEELEEEELEQA